MEDEKAREQVEEVTTTTFSIQGVPVKVFKRFIEFCKHNAVMTKVYKDRKGQKQIKQELCYSIALAQLLDSNEADAKNQMLYHKVQKIEDALITKGILNGKSPASNTKD